MQHLPQHGAGDERHHPCRRQRQRECCPPASQKGREYRTHKGNNDLQGREGAATPRSFCAVSFEDFLFLDGAVCLVDAHNQRQTEG